MIAKTKKFALDPTVYVMTNFKNLVIDHWWIILLIPVPFIAGAYLVPDYSSWFIGTAIAGPILYLLFWLIQFAGATKLKEMEIMFQKLSYEIDSRQIMMKVKANQGMPIQWNMIKSARKSKDSFVLKISRAQIIHLPFDTFQSKQHVQFVESILRRKDLIK